MARTILTSLLALALTTTAHSAALFPRQSPATCNIDLNPFQTADAFRACNAIPDHSALLPFLPFPLLFPHPFSPPPLLPTVTLTGTTTLLAQSPTDPEVTVILTQQNTNWSGSGAAAKQICQQIVTTCGGTVGVAEMNGASIPTDGAFGGQGVIGITV